jgi:DNA gyrase inhibitor GyrI
MLLGVFIVGLGLAAKMGAFAEVKMSTAERGPYRLGVLDHTGPYGKIGPVILKAKTMLTPPSGQELGPACGVYLDDPETVKPEEQRSLGGFVIPEGTLVKSPARNVQVLKRRVVVAEVDAHPLVAAMKIYPAIEEWLAANKKQAAGPVVEFYRESGVEAEMPIEPAGATLESGPAPAPAAPGVPDGTTGPTAP